MAPPISRLRLGVPPSFRNAVTPPVRDPLPQLSHVTLAEPYPRPKPIQNPLRRGGYCARAAGAATLSKPAAAKMHAAVRIEPSLEMTPRGKANSVPVAGRPATPSRCPLSGARGGECDQ